jgi:hypothetical protein
VHGRDQKFIKNLSGDVKGTYHSGGIGIYGKVILKWIVNRF